MNFFDKIVLPLSPEHAALLNVIQILTLLLFLPFTGMLLGGATLSLYFNSKGKKNGNAVFTQIARDITDKLMIKKSVGYAMGLLPIITITIIYAQFLYNAKVVSVNLLVFSALYYFIGLLFLYKYKNTFKSSIKKRSLLSYLVFWKKYEGDENAPEPVLVTGNSKFGYAGLFSLMIAILLFAGGTVNVLNPDRWFGSSVLKVFLSLSVWTNVFYFIFSAFTVTGAAILYFFFVFQGGIKNADDDYKEKLKSVVLPVTLISIVAQSFLLFLNIVMIPKTSLSSSVYVYTVFALLCILLSGILLLGVYKNSEMKYAGVLFFLVFLVFMFTSVKDQLALGNAVKEHLESVYVKSEEIAKETSSKIVSTSGISGEKIYNEKCSACHKFDVKLVGPPYQETIPKYNGDVKKLAQFIYNPVKVNPDFPPMPNQGLKMKEAEAVASWLMSKVKK